VTKIPPEHPAAKSLEHAFRSLGTEKARERRRTGGAGRAGRLAVAALAPVLAVAAVATGTKVFTGDGGALRPDARGNRDPEGQRDLTPSGRALAAASATDPKGGLPWGLRIYRSASGRTCVTVGRVLNGRLGFARPGQFREIPAGYAGVCGRFREAHIVLAGRQSADGSHVVYGAVDRSVRRLHLQRSGTGTAEVPIASDGTFLVVRHGSKAFRHQLLIVDGASKRVTIPLDPT
jgi:hypothetical protein